MVELIHSRTDTKRVILFVSWLVFLTSGVTASQSLQPDSSPQPNQRLKAELERENRPINKGKTILKLADWELNQARMQTLLGEIEQADQCLIRYTDWIKEAKDIFSQEHLKAPKKNQDTFRNAELLLRRQVRQLENLKTSFSFDQQQVILKALDIAHILQEDLLVYLFGEENVRGKNANKTDAPEEKE
jgi:hypothetical protein